MFQRQVKETFIYYSYVEWNTVQIWDVKLSINDFNIWFRCDELDIHNLIAWQNENKILLRFYKTTSKIDPRDGLSRNNCPGDYDPDWEPKMTLYFLINDYPFNEFILTTEMKSKPIACGKPNCNYQAARASTIEKHRSNCRDYTEIESKQVSYGKPVKSMEPIFKFCVFFL